MNRKSFWTGLAIGGGVIAAVVLVLVLGGGSDDGADATATATATESAEPTEAATSSYTSADFARADADDPMAIGDIDAPVLMIEWADLRCHYCGVFAQETLPTLLSDYVDEGLLRIEWHSAPVLGDTSTDAAVAARSAGEQGLFWEFIEAIYATGPTGQTEWTQDALVGVASGIDGMDIEAFTAGLSDPELISAEETEAAQATGWGITGTPMFVIGNRTLGGAHPLEDFRAAIDAQL